MHNFHAFNFILDAFKLGEKYRIVESYSNRLFMWYSS